MLSSVLSCTEILERAHPGKRLDMKSVREIFSTVQCLISRQDAQDLVEYALVVALIALAATAGMGTLAADINNAFVNIGTSLTNAL